MMLERLIGLLGILVVLGVAYACSQNRQAIRWKSVAMGLTLQFGFAIAILGIPALGIPGVLRFVFEGLNWLVTSLVDFTNAGSRFVFGPLAQTQDPWGFIFATRALPTIIFFSALMSGLYHLGILQRVVKAVAIVMQKTMGTSGAETLSGAANIFMGQTEAPLLVRPFIGRMTTSEIYCVMVGGMATLAAGVEGAYIGLLKGRISDIAGHLLTASVLGAIGGLIVSKIIFPETEKPQTAGHVELQASEKPDANFLEAIARGASDGAMLAINVGAMLIAFIALIAILDAMVAKVGVWAHLTEPISFSYLLGKVCQPFAWLLGVPWSEASQVGRFLGEKIALNEFVAYVDLSQMGAQLSTRTVLIASYALCGFANFSSIGIQIGGIGGMAPEQKSNIAKLGFLAVLGGNLACFLSACIAGLLF
jgi:CNT family concentrative nucleoside transporter